MGLYIKTRASASASRRLRLRLRRTSPAQFSPLVRSEVVNRVPVVKASGAMVD